MKPSDICLLFRYRDETMMDRFLSNNLDFCECFVALDDRSNSRENFELLMKHPKCAGIIRKEELFSHVHAEQSLDRESLYALGCSTYKPVFLYLDIDEIMSLDFHNEMKLIDPVYNTNEVTVFSFPMLYMYPDEQHYIVDGIYGNRRINAMFMSRLDLYYERHPSVHKPRMPVMKGDAFLPWNEIQLSSPIYHYSMSSQETRQRRHKFYTTLDPTNAFQEVGYDHLLSEHPFVSVIPNIKEPPNASA